MPNVTFSSLVRNMANGSEKESKCDNQAINSNNDQIVLNRSKSASITQMSKGSTSMSLFPPPSPVSILRHGKHSHLSQSSLRRSMNSLSEDLYLSTINKFHSSSVLNGSNYEKRLTPSLQITPVDTIKDQIGSELSLDSFTSNNRHAVTIQDTDHSPMPSVLGGTVNSSVITISSRRPSEIGSKSFFAKQSQLKNRRQSNDALSAALSATYCKFLVVLGVCLPITDIISDHLPIYVYQGFYIYLYTLSVGFVVFLYTHTFQHRKLYNALKLCNERGGNVLLKYKATHFGSFYLRIGAIAFAIGTMVYSGLEFGQYFELNDLAGCHNIFVAITPICRMTLCIAQVQFIFLNTAYMDMARHKVTCRFGLMHMVATNLCEWLYVLVEETKHEIYHISHSNVSFKQTITNSNDHSNDQISITNISSINLQTNSTLQNTDIVYISTEEVAGHGCTRTTIMGSLVQQLSPFLFPCTIEYSLICAVILYEMWKTVKSIPNIDRTRKTSLKPIYQKPAHHFSVDCSQSHRGLFFGILIIVITIIAMIMYFVLHAQPDYDHVAVQEITIWETIMYTLCGIAVLSGMFLMRDLRYVKGAINEQHTMELDNLLLVVAQTGVYLYAVFSILGSYFIVWKPNEWHWGDIIAEVLSLLQTSMQTLFILNASHRRCKGSTQQRQKPAREIITFLLIANIAIWFMNTLIKGRAVFRATHMEYFGVWTWTIITHVSMPLAIFYRFHSTICLFEIWKIAYKSKSH